MIVRDDLISRRATWKALRQMHGITEGVGVLKIVGRGEGEMVDRDKVEYMLEEIDPVPPQAPNLLAECDRLKEINKELLAELKSLLTRMITQTNKVPSNQLHRMMQREVVKTNLVIAKAEEL